MVALINTGLYENQTTDGQDWKQGVGFRGCCGGPGEIGPGSSSRSGEVNAFKAYLRDCGIC